MAAALSDSPTAFISYDRNNLPLATRLEIDLKRAGIKVWRDHTGIPLDSPDWKKAILANIRASKYFVLIASLEAAESIAVKAELCEAKKLRKSIIMLYTTKPEDLPKSWKRRQLLNFVFSERRYQEALQVLLGALSEKKTEAKPDLFKLLEKQNPPLVSEAAVELRDQQFFDLDGATYRYLTLAPSAYSCTYLVAPADKSLKLPNSLGFLVQCSGPITRETIQQVIKDRLDRKCDPWVLFLKGHVPKDTNEYKLPLDKKHIWRDTADAITRALLSTPFRGKQVDLYFDSPGILAFEVGGLLRGMISYRGYQFDYQNAYWEVISSNH